MSLSASMDKNGFPLCPVYLQEVMPDDNDICSLCGKHSASRLDENNAWREACQTCDGIGTIDETLGGEFFSDPAAECPDCHGKGCY